MIHTSPSLFATTRRIAALLCATGALAASSGSSSAADTRTYPNRPIRLILAFSGGVMDSLARALGDRLEHALGQPVVVEARTGASGNIAAEYVARAAPDGYTLLVAPVTITVLPSTHGARAVDPERAFAPITKLTTLPSLIVANAGLGVGTLPDLIALARSFPGKFAYATPGIGTTQHLGASLLWTRANVNLRHVPYSNPGQVIKDVVAGEVPVALTLVATGEPFVRSGRLRALATTGARRAAAFPDVPTVAELGFPGFDFVTWYGLVAPAGTPREIIETLYKESARFINLPEVRSKLFVMGGVPVANTPEQFAAEIRADIARWPAIVRVAAVTDELQE